MGVAVCRMLRYARGQLSRRDVHGLRATEGHGCMVSILILNHNALNHLRQCLLSIEAFTPIAHELIVVDNGSSDGSVQHLRDADIADMTLVENPVNIGCPAARAQGMALAEGDYVLLLDNDTIVTPGWLDTLVGHCERIPRLGLVGPTTNYISGKQLREGVRYSSAREMAEVALRITKENRNRLERANRLVGFCMLIERAVVDKIGVCDSRFGLYGYEDDDYTNRAKLAGFEACIAHDVFIHHTGNQGSVGEAADYPGLIMQAWQAYRAKWDLPADRTQGEHALDTEWRPPARTFNVDSDYIAPPDVSTVEALVTRRT